MNIHKGKGLRFPVSSAVQYHNKYECSVDPDQLASTDAS